MAEPTFNYSSSRQRGHGCWPAHLRPLALTWTLPFFGYCSVCGSVFLLQALMAIAPCATGSRTALEISGDRTKRHNRLRTVLAAKATAAGLSPEVEKMGLLPERPEELGASEVGRPSVSQRRPADVYLPNWGAYGPAAMDLAATSGMRGSVLATSAGDRASAAANYEIRKKIHHNTAPAVCWTRLTVHPAGG